MKEFTPDNWKQLDMMLEAVLDQAPENREETLKKISAGDELLLRRLKKLLKMHDEAGVYLGESASTFAGPLITGLAEHLEEGSDAEEGGKDPFKLLRTDQGKDEDIPEGSRIGPYEILAIAGRGGMGTVYRARRADGAFDREVAVKLIRRGMDTEDILKRFRYEQQILATLDHPDIAGIQDAGMSPDGRPYFVMDFIHGEPVDRFCDNRGLGIRERLALFVKICRAVAYAHQKLVVHRDLKPSNIMVADDGRITLLDFGIARILDDDNPLFPAPLTRPGMNILTPEFAAPEQLNHGEITTATDVYSLGMLLLTLLTGRTARFSPDAHPRPSQLLQTAHKPGRADEKNIPDPGQVASSRATDPEKLSRQLRGDLDAILLTALSEDPSRRYPSVDMLMNDIINHLTDKPITASAGSSWYRIRKFAMRHRSGVAVAFVFLMLLTGFAAAMAYQVRIVTHEKNIASRERDRARSERDKAHEITSLLEELLSAANPLYGTTRADTLRIRDFVRLSTDNIRNELVRQPEVKAQMLAILGNIHRNLGMYDEALPLLEEALAVRISLHGDPHADVASSYNDLGNYYYDRRETDRAEELIKKGLDLRSKLPDDDRSGLASAYTSLAHVHNSSGDLVQAESWYSKALHLWETEPDQDELKTATALMNLATVLYKSGNLEESEKMHRQVLERQLRVLAEDHPRVAASENNYGILLSELGRHEEARDYVERALTNRVRIYGEEHPESLTSLNNLATILSDLGDYAEAEKKMIRSLQLRVKIHGERSVPAAIALNNLSSIQRRGGRLQEALESIREAVSIVKAAAGDQHPSTGIMIANEAFIMRLTGDPERAEQLYRSSLDIMALALSDDHPSIARQRVGLAESLADQGRYHEAEEFMLAGYEALLSKGSDATGAANSLATLYDAWGKTDKARTYRELAGVTVTEGP